MRRLSLLSALALAVASGAGAQDVPCEYGPGRDAEPYDALRPESLVGRFQLVRIGTSWPEGAASLTDTAELELHLATPEEQEEALREGIGRMPRAVTHVGRYYRSRQYGPDLAETEGDSGLIYVGCRPCLDASPWLLYVAAVSADGFWGLWKDNQTGIGRVFDDGGRPLPDPAGYFCARRIDGS